MQVYSPRSFTVTGPTLKTPGCGSVFDTRLAWGWWMNVVSVPLAVLSKKKDTDLFLKLGWDWGLGEGTEQVKDNMSPCFTTPAEGSTDRLGGGKDGMEWVGVATEEAQRGREIIVFIFSSSYSIAYTDIMNSKTYPCKTYFYNQTTVANETTFCNSLRFIAAHIVCLHGCVRFLYEGQDITTSACRRQ